MFTFLAGIGTPLVIFVYLLLGVAGVAQGRRTAQAGFQATGALAALVGVVAVFGGLYYSFVPTAPGAEIPLQMAMVPWVCLAVAGAGAALAAWTRRYRQPVWALDSRPAADPHHRPGAAPGVVSLLLTALRDLFSRVGSAWWPG